MPFDASTAICCSPKIALLKTQARQHFSKIHGVFFTYGHKPFNIRAVWVRYNFDAITSSLLSFLSLQAKKRGKENMIQAEEKYFFQAWTANNLFQCNSMLTITPKNHYFILKTTCSWNSFSDFWCRHSIQMNKDMVKKNKTAQEEEKEEDLEGM